MIGCLGDEHHGASTQVDAVNEDDVMNLIDDRAKAITATTAHNACETNDPCQANPPDGVG